VLIQIKSRMLLPRDPLLAEDQQEDPRMELVNRLLEHERFKTAAQMLLQKSQIEEAVWSNPALKEFKDDAGAEPELAADVVDLVKVFQQIVERAKSRPVIDVDEERVTVAQMMDFFRKRLSLADRPVRLKQVLSAMKSRQVLICAFLALLEMVRLQAILLRQDKVFSDIIVKKNTMFDIVFAEGGAATMRDDWK
jgi:segregation and condensation protein A